MQKVILLCWEIVLRLNDTVRKVWRSAVGNCWFLFELYWSRSLRLAKFHWKSWTTPKVSFSARFWVRFRDLSSKPKGNFFSLSCFGFGSPKVVIICLTILLGHTLYEEVLPAVTFVEVIKKTFKINSHMFSVAVGDEHSRKLRINFYC